MCLVYHTEVVRVIRMYKTFCAHDTAAGHISPASPRPAGDPDSLPRSEVSALSTLPLWCSCREQLCYCDRPCSGPAATHHPSKTVTMAMTSDRKNAGYWIRGHRLSGCPISQHLCASLLLPAHTCRALPVQDSLVPCPLPWAVRVHSARSDARTWR